MMRKTKILQVCLVCSLVLTPLIAGKKKQYPHKILARIQTGKVPSALTLAPDETLLFVSNLKENSVAIIDTSTFSVIAKIKDLKGPLGIAVTNDSKTAYVCESLKDTVAVVSVAMASVVSRIKVGKNPCFAHLDAEGKKLYVTNNRSNDLSVIDTGKGMEIARVPTADRPLELCLDPNGKFAYAACGGVQKITVIDLDTRKKTSDIPKSDKVHIAVLSDIEFAPDGKHFYAPGVYGELYVFDAATWKTVKEISVENEPYGIAAAPDGRLVYVSNYHAGTVSVVDTETLKVLGRFKAGKGAGLVDISKDGKTVYVCVEEDNEVLAVEIYPPNADQQE